MISLLKKLQLLRENQFSRGVVWNTLSFSILGISGILINFIIVSFRGVDALGVFNQVFAIYLLSSQFSVGGIQFSVLKHCSYNQKDVLYCSLVAVSGLFPTLLLASFVAIVLTLSRGYLGHLLNSPAVAEGILWAMPGLVLFSLNKILLMYLNGRRLMGQFAFFQAARFIFLLACISVLLLKNCSSSKLPLSLTISETTLFIVLLINCTITESLTICGLDWLDFYDWVKKHISFGVRGFASGVLIECNTKVDLLMIGFFLSDMEVGIYSFASTIALGYGQIITILKQNVDPVVGALFAKGAKKEIEQLSKKLKKIFYPVMFVLGCLVLAFYPVILKPVSASEQLQGSWGVLFILVTGIWLISSYRAFIGLITIGGRPGVFSVLMLAAVLLNFLTNSLFIPLMGIYGAAVATSLVYILEANGLKYAAFRFFQIRL